MRNYGIVVISLSFVFSIFLYSQLIGFTKIKNIRIVGNEYIKKSLIENYIELNDESDILFFDISEHQNKINKIDYIKSCCISRIFPSTLIVEVIENSPIAHVKTVNREFILDMNGTLLPFSEQVVEYFALPVIKMNNTTELEIHQLNQHSELFGAELTDLKLKFPQIFNGISTFEFKSRGDVVIKYGNKTKIFVHEDKLNLHFKILDEFNDMKSNLSKYSFIDVRVKDQLIVKENRYKNS